MPGLTGLPGAGAVFLAASMLAACGGGYTAVYTRPINQVTAAERQMIFGWAVVDCIVQADRSLGQCRVIEASPDTTEVREAALQGMQMHGTVDLPAEARPGNRTRRRIQVAGS